MEPVELQKNPMTPSLPPVVTLGSLKVGDRAKICGFHAMQPPFRYKLMAMGLIPGTELTVIHKAPLGDPVAVSVRGFVLCLRKKEVEGLCLQRC